MGLLVNRKRRTAVAYYRHSAEDKQENSVAIQRQHAHKFAQQNKIEIIHEEADEGKSGLQANRPGFQKLFHSWILNPNKPQFNYVLVLDVSRWGRFQDQDEAAHYEFLCREAGKQVVYVNQGFPRQEEHLIGSLRTSLERYMAAEYSRQLSDKVFHGSVEVSRQGFSAGGPPPFAMARLLLNSKRQPIRILQPGEHKQIANERVTFVPEKNNRSEIVKQIFSLFVEKNLGLHEISEKLNGQPTINSSNRPWTLERIRRILRNPKYTGTLVYNKTSNRLKKGRKNNPRSEWIIVENAFPTLVEKRIFDQAQERLQGLGNDHQEVSDVIAKAKQIVRTHLNQLGKGTEHNLLTSYVPIIFSVTRKIHAREWCFIVPPKLKQYEKILAVGVKDPRLNKQQWESSLIEELFLLPESAFNPMMFLLLSEKEKDFRNYRINEQAFNRTVVEFTQTKGKACRPFSSKPRTRQLATNRKP